MRALRLCGLTLAVVAAHLIGWRCAVAGWPQAALARAGVQWIALAMARRPSAALAPTTATTAQAPPPPRPSVDTAANPPARPTQSTRSEPASAHRQAIAAAGPAPATASGHAAPRTLPRTGNAGATRRAADGAPAWPTYPTRAPPAAALHYVLVQGEPRTDVDTASAARGTAEIDWVHDAATFSLRVTFAPARQAAREWVSAGTFDAAGVAPIRLAERERGRDKRAINFDRDAGRVRFSGATLSLPLAPGAQDRWSWVAQLAAIAEAASTPPAHRTGDADRHTSSVRSPTASSGDSSGRAGRAPVQARTVPPGTSWLIQVAGLRGELEPWIFHVLPDTALPAEAGFPGNRTSTHADRAPALLHVVREPQRPYDLRIEAWLSPSLHHLPIGLRMSTPPGSWAIALWPSTSVEVGSPSGGDDPSDRPDSTASEPLISDRPQPTGIQSTRKPS